MKRRGTQGDLKGMADAYLGRLDPKGKRFGSRATSAWNRVVGEEISRHTTGSALRDGELLVYVDSAVWANELAAMSEHLRERLNEEMGEALVRSVRFAVSRKVAEQRKEREAEEQIHAHYAKDDVESVALTEQERLQVEYMTAAIADEGLRDAAVRAMTRHLEWKKGTRARNGRQASSE
jgi:hypothetical protein